MITTSTGVDITGDLEVTSTSSDVAFLRSSQATTTNVYITNTNATTNNTANLYFAPANNIAGSYIKSTAIEDFSTSANRTSDLRFAVRKDGTFNEAVIIDSSSNSTFAGDVTIDGGTDSTLNIYKDNAGNGKLSFYNDTTQQVFLLHDSAENFYIHAGSGSAMILSTNGATTLTLDTSNNATFAGNITSTGTTITLDSAGSADYIADRANDTSGATYQYKTNGSLKWYTGLRGVSSEDFNIFNNAQGSTALLLNSSNNNATFSGSVTISHSSGDSLTLTKTTTEPSFRIEGDTDKDFVITVSGELLTFTQNDGVTDILTLDHDTKNATFGGNVEVNGTLIDLDSAGTATVRIDRGATSDAARVQWFNAGSEYFKAGLNGTDNNLWSLLHTCGSGFYFNGSAMTYGFNTSSEAYGGTVSIKGSHKLISSSPGGKLSRFYK